MRLSLNTYCISLLLMVLLFSQCTSSNWVISDYNAIDSTSAKQIQTYEFVDLIDIEQGGRSTLTFQIKQVKTVEYDSRIKTRRQIQSYSPKWGWWLIGFGTSVAFFYSANSDMLGDFKSDVNSLILNIIGVSNTVLTFYQQKPVGNHIETNEYKLLNKTGEIIAKDTIAINPSETRDAIITILFRNQPWVNNFPLQVNSKEFRLPLKEVALVDYINDREANEVVFIDLEYRNNVYKFSVPIKQIMKPYVLVNKKSPIRSSAAIASGNIYTELNARSILPLISEEDRWYAVRYGAASAWLSKNDTELVWSYPALDINTFIKKGITTPGTVVDIEINLPKINTANANDFAFFLTADQDRSNSYKQEDVRILSRYLKESFNYREQNITSMNLSQWEIYEDSFKEFLITKRDPDNIVLHISGALSEVNGQIVIETGSNQIPLVSIFEQMKDLKPRTIIGLLDFKYPDKTPLGYEKKLEEAWNSVFFRSGIEHCAIVSAKPGQKNLTYQSMRLNINNKYSLFIYQLCLAFKRDLIQTGDIFDFANKEVNYTSRRLYNQPQELIIWGNITLSF